MGLFSKHMHSIHVGHHKDTADCESVVIPVPEKVYISMSQHIGRPCQPLVKKGDLVKVGQRIGDVDAPVSAPVHASVSGEVISIEESRTAMGSTDTFVVIASDGRQEPWEGLQIPHCETKDDFIKAVRDSGLVGLGGASFPTHVKFNPANLDECDTLIVNGAECEPFITSDHRNMLEHTDDIISGIRLTMKYLGLSKCYVGIENNKPDAIEKIRIPPGGGKSPDSRNRGKNAESRSASGIGGLYSFQCDHDHVRRSVFPHGNASDSANGNSGGRCGGKSVQRRGSRRYEIL